jgi:LPXTG-site transpeptidase (sortase) family protein
MLSIGAGVTLLLYVMALQMGWLPLSDFTVPAPVAASVESDEMALSQDMEAQLANIGLDATAETPAPVDATRAQGPEVMDGPLPPPGVANQLAIPAIGLETYVAAGGPVANKATGQMEWQTSPFVAVHYAKDTSLVGKPGNAVLAGHVVTLSMGNVFRDLYRVVPGDRVFVRTQAGDVFAYEITKVRVVNPSDISAMAPTSDAEVTLVTCAGTYDVRSKTFNKRLIVAGKLIGTIAS